MYRNVELIIYDEDILKVELKILNKNNISYAYILHDKDDVKPHYHLRMFCKDKKSLNAWANLLCVEIHDIEILQFKKLSIRYLIHLDNPEKYQYNINEIKANFDILPYFSEKTCESNDIMKIMSFIDESGYISLRYLYNYIIENELWSTYRRNYSIIKELLFEHNREYTT